MVDELVWVRLDSLKHSGYFLLHTFDLCLIGLKGSPTEVEFPKHVMHFHSSVLNGTHSWVNRDTRVRQVIDR